MFVSTENDVILGESLEFPFKTQKKLSRLIINSLFAFKFQPVRSFVALATHMINKNAFQ